MERLRCSSAEPSAVRAELNAFLAALYPPEMLDHQRDGPARARPFVTLTYAQSLDGRIAGVAGRQIILSGLESMGLTHRLRELHTFVLVGIGTVLADDPQLTARLPTLLPLNVQARPIVVDSLVRMPLSAKLITNSDGRNSQPISKPPLVIHAAAEGAAQRVAELEAHGVQCHVGKYSEGKLDLEEMLDHLATLEPGGGSLMVEGGASIISSFLDSGLVDLVIITIAPIFVGEGVGVSTNRISLPGLEHVVSRTFGQDVVVVCRPVRKAV